MNAPRPSWFKDNKVLVSNPLTCGINKDGLEQYKVDILSGARSKTDIDNQLEESVNEILAGEIKNIHTKYIDVETVKNSRVVVPQYHDVSTIKEIEDLFANNNDFYLASLGELQEAGKIAIFPGHGSPSSDQRVGSVPYIKVSDLRAGHININSSNLIPLSLAEKYWRGSTSGLEAYDLISPERASKNIGEFSVLMPGQEQIVLTKEVMIIRSLEKDFIDQFYLLWALSLKSVRKQWGRIILMQTNREDVGSRMKEIIIPVPKNDKIAIKYSSAFRSYYQSLEQARVDLNTSLKADDFESHFRIE